MEKPISVGDLVQVVRNAPCGCLSRYLGVPFVVEIIGATALGHECSYCKGTIYQAGVTLYQSKGSVIRVTRDRIIRIDPPAIPESVQTEETLKETA